MIIENKEKRIAHISQRVWSLINQIDHLKGRWIGGAKLNPQALGRLKRSVLVTSSAASTRIEGANLSDEDVEKLMRGISVQKFKDRDAQEAQGYFELLSRVFVCGNKSPFNESMIKHSHKELLKHVDKDQRHRGEYKKTENNVEMFDESGKSIGVVFKRPPPISRPSRCRSSSNGRLGRWIKRIPPSPHYWKLPIDLPRDPSIPGW